MIKNQIVKSLFVAAEACLTRHSILLLCLFLLVPATAIGQLQRTPFENAETQKGSIRGIGAATVDCVFLERANSEKTWKLSLNNSILKNFGDRILIYGGGSAGIDSHKANLFVLNKDELVPISLSNIPNTSRRKDWQQAPLNNLVRAGKVSIPGNFFPIFVDDGILVQESSKLTGSAPRKMYREVANRFRTLSQHDPAVPSVSTRRLTSAEVESFLDGRTRKKFSGVPMRFSPAGTNELLFHSSDLGRRVSAPASGEAMREMVITSMDLQLATLDSGKSLPFAANPDYSFVLVKALKKEQVFEIHSNGKSEVVAIDYGTGNLRKVCDLLSVAHPPRLVGERIVVRAMDGKSQIVQEIELNSGEVIRKYELPKDLWFAPTTPFDRAGGGLHINKNGQLVIACSKQNDEQDPLNRSTVFLVIKSDWKDSRLIENLTVGATGTDGQRGVSFVVDNHHVYFVADLPSNLLSWEKGWHTGNFALYRATLPTF